MKKTRQKQQRASARTKQHEEHASIHIDKRTTGQLAEKSRVQPEQEETPAAASAERSASSHSSMSMCNSKSQSRSTRRAQTEHELTKSEAKPLNAKAFACRQCSEKNEGTSKKNITALQQSAPMIQKMRASFMGFTFRISSSRFPFFSALAASAKICADCFAASAIARTSSISAFRAAARDMKDVRLSLLAWKLAWRGSKVDAICCLSQAFSSSSMCCLASANSCKASLLCWFSA